MIIPPNHRTTDYGCVNIIFRIIVIIMIFKTLKKNRVFNLKNPLVVLRHQSLLEENHGVLMSIAYKTLVLLTQLPLLRCINPKEPFSFFLIKIWILVPDHFWIIHFPCQNKSIYLVPMVSADSLT